MYFRVETEACPDVVPLNDPGEPEGGADEIQTPAERFRTRHDWEGTHSLSMSVVKAVSAVTGATPVSMDPLCEVVDPDALDELLASVRGDERARVTFSYHECGVAIDGKGEIIVQPKETDSL